MLRWRQQERRESHSEQSTVGNIDKDRAMAGLLERRQEEDKLLWPERTIPHTSLRGGGHRQRGVEQWETTGLQESWGQKGENRYCTWDHSRPMSARKQRGCFGRIDRSAMMISASWLLPVHDDDVFYSTCATFSSLIHSVHLQMPQKLTFTQLNFKKNTTWNKKGKLYY